MARLSWNNPEGAVYETGLDRGVIYPWNERGVAWSGLKSVSEKNSKGSVGPIYYEGEKFDLLTIHQERTSTVTAYTYPEVLDELVGRPTDYHGFTYGEQEPDFFSMCYRTLVGGGDYLIHVLFNQIATINDVARDTVNATPSATEFSWELEGVPVTIQGRRTTYLTLDTRKLDPNLMSILEGTLYGTEYRDSNFIEFMEYLG